MNVLSHYLLDKDHPSVYHMLGVILPDVVNGFNQKLRRAVFHHQDLAVPEHQELLSGIKKHYLVDRIFHQTDFFSNFTQLIKEELRQLPLPSLEYRSYFLAHILLEMLLDRLLIKQTPSLPVEMYKALNSINQTTVSTYLDSIGKASFKKELFGVLKRFISSRFLYYYTDNENFVRALLRVYQNINPKPPEREEVNQLIVLTDRLESNYSKEMLRIFGKMEEHLAVPC